MGALAILISGLFAAYSLYAKLFRHESPQGFTALVLLITFLSGVLLFFLGIIGEYVGRVYEEIKARPLYVIKKAVGCADGLPIRKHIVTTGREAEYRDEAVAAGKTTTN